jgi:hypothetical protein
VIRPVAFPRGSCEGLVVLSIEYAPGVDLVDAAKHVQRELARRPGLWGVWVQGFIDWKGRGVAELIEAVGTSMLLADRKLEDVTSWPAANVAWILDASETVRACKDERELALRLAEHAWLPEVRDLIVELDEDQQPPDSAMLSMLVAHCRPDAAYVTIPREYPLRSTLINHVTGCVSTHWAVRWR